MSLSKEQLLQEQECLLDACLNAYAKFRHAIKLFCDPVRDYFSTHPVLALGPEPVIHSVRSRLKDPTHLKKKLLRKCVEKNKVITPECLLADVTDLAGVRVLHLHSSQFPAIHESILEYESLGQWALREPPKAYTWDPDCETFFEGIGIKAHLKDSHYTSVHYVVQPNKENPVCCEIQVRTLFEEVWGEVDHMLNYPSPSGSVACREQLRVLAKLTGAGVRLVDSIVRSHGEFETKPKTPAVGPVDAGEESKGEVGH